MEKRKKQNFCCVTSEDNSKKTRLQTERVYTSKQRNCKSEAKIILRLSQMEDCSFSSDEFLGVCVSEDFRCDLELTDYLLAPHGLQFK
jgi:hypothetical protein